MATPANIEHLSRFIEEVAYPQLIAGHILSREDLRKLWTEFGGTPSLHPPSIESVIIRKHPDVWRICPPNSILYVLCVPLDTS